MNSTLRHINAHLDKQFKDHDDYVIDMLVRHGRGILCMFTVEHASNKTGHIAYFKDRGERLVWMRTTD